MIFGKANGFPQNLNLSNLTGSNGFKISGDLQFGFPPLPLGARASGLGDINADGFDDIVVQAQGGPASVIFGKSSFPANLKVSKLRGGDGFRLDGNFYWPINAAGDVNGDGIDDFILSVDNSAGGARYENVVVFGRSIDFPSALDPLLVNGMDGFKMVSDSDRPTSIGDVNGDGFGDLQLKQSVVFGKAGPFSSSMDISDLDGSEPVWSSAPMTGSRRLLIGKHSMEQMGLRWTCRVVSCSWVAVVQAT